MLLIYQHAFFKKTKEIKLKSFSKPLFLNSLEYILGGLRAFNFQHMFFPKASFALSKFLISSKMKLFYFLVFLAQSYDIVELEKNLDVLVESLRVSNAIPGVSLAVVDLKNENFISKGYGKRRVDQEDPVSEETLFCLASNSKLFTGVYSALVEKYTGISLDAKVNDIPELKDDEDIFLMLNSCSLSQEVTLRDFLSHRTGTKARFKIFFSYFALFIKNSEL